MYIGIGNWHWKSGGAVVDIAETQHLPEGAWEEEEIAFDEHILPKGALLQSRYEVLKVLGVGGMGAVYQARDLRFTNVSRLCAVKEMISSTPDPIARRVIVQNFEREANVLASLNHPSCPKIYDFFTEGTRSYIVMEYIDGHDLEAILEETDGFLAERQVLEWAIQICDLLAYLHHQEPNPIVFRDMKPSNIMLKGEGHIMLIDFGIAKVFQSGQKGTMIGTEGYSPPEQYRGTAEPRGDLYALGATLHHLLTKRDPRLEPPFTFHDAPPSSINPAISKATEDAIMKALEYELESRFASALEMKQALIRALGGTGPADTAALAQPTEVVEGEEQDVVAVWEFKCEDEVRSSPAIAEGTLFIGAYDNNLYAIDVKTGKFRWKYATEGGIPATPCVWQGSVFIGSEDRIMYALESATGRIIWTCPTEGRIRSSGRVEFEHIFFGSDDSRLYAVNARSGRVAWRFEAGAPIRSTPTIGEETIYFGAEDGYFFGVDLQGGASKWRFRAQRGITSSPIFYEGMIIVGSQDWHLYALDAKSGWTVWRFRTNKAIVSSPCVDEGGCVYFGSVDGNLYAVDVGSGRLVWKFDCGAQITSSPALDTGRVYFGTGDGYVISLDTKTGKERWRFKTGGPVPSSPKVVDGIVYIGSTDHKVYALPA
jgi:outer membrane protein assembly factor BamB/predicted Ser/Thr protein kinase